MSKGRYSNLRELANPRAADYVDRFQPYVDSTVARDFNVKEFRSNLVLRWEYKPGSSIYLVWTQGRQDFEQAYGTRSFQGDFDNLFHQHPDNTFLIKASHWFDW